MSFEVYGNVYKYQHQYNCYKMQSLSGALKCRYIWRVYLIQHAISIHITVLFHNVETRFRITQKFTPSDFLSGQVAIFIEETVLRHLGMYFATLHI